MAATSVNHLGVEYGYEFFEKTIELSEEGKAIQAAMENLGLMAQPERSHVFTVFSPDDLRAIAIAVTPFSSDDRKLEGSLSISEGGHAQGVVVEMDGQKVVGFTHFAMEDGQLRSDQYRADQLMTTKARTLASEAGKIKSARPLVELNVRHVVSISSVTFSSLLTDDFARSVYSQEEIKGLRSNARIVSEISRFVLLRTSGSSCCSCSTSCWGSCSSSSSYVG